MDRSLGPARLGVVVRAETVLVLRAHAEDPPGQQNEHDAGLGRDDQSALRVALGGRARLHVDELPQARAGVLPQRQQPQLGRQLEADVVRALVRIPDPVERVRPQPRGRLAFDGLLGQPFGALEPLPHAPAPQLGRGGLRGVRPGSRQPRLVVREGLDAGDQLLQLRLPPGALLVRGSAGHVRGAERRQLGPVPDVLGVARVPVQPRDEQLGVLQPLGHLL